MEKNLIKLSFVLIVLLYFMSGVKVLASNEIHDNTVYTYGDNVTWKKVGDHLIFEGYGSMKNCELVVGDYNLANFIPAPWHSIREEIRNITISHGITSIGNYAFYELDNLKHVSIPDSVISVGNQAFSDCSSLEAIYLPNSVTVMGRGVFANCRSLKYTNIPTNLKTIPAISYEYCYALEEITIPHGVEVIGAMAFYACDNLTNLIIPDSVTTIGIQAFSNCKNLQLITIPSSARNIADSIFYLTDDVVVNCYENSTIHRYMTLNYSFLDVTFIESEATNTTEISVCFNGQRIEFDQPPIIYDGCTLVPARKIFEELGVIVSWDEELQCVVATKDSIKIIIAMDSKIAYVNGDIKRLDSPAINVNGRVLVPIRFVSETLGYYVDWDATAQVINIY